MFLANHPCAGSWIDRHLLAPLLKSLVVDRLPGLRLLIDYLMTVCKQQIAQGGIRASPLLDREVMAR